MSDYRESYFKTPEELEEHLALAARIKESMDKTLNIIKRESKLTMTEDEFRARMLQLEEAKFQHQCKMDDAYLEFKEQELRAWTLVNLPNTPLEETP